MIYLFTWNNDFLVKEQIKKWKDLFIKKYGDFNLVHIKNIASVYNHFLLEILTTRGFFDSKKLIIIDSVPLSYSEKNWDLKSKQDFIESILENIPEENIVVFSSINPGQSSKFYKILKQIAEVKEFNSKSINDLKLILQKRFWDSISYNWINSIIKYKWANLTKIISELEKLFITRDFIDVEDIEKNVFPELEESIFLFIDDLFNLNLKNSLKKMNIILQQTNVYVFYNSLLSNLRIRVFIWKLKSLKVPNSEILSILDLWNRSFLVWKSYKISHEILEKLYLRLVELDKKMKTWSIIWTEENDFKFEIENVFINFLF